MQSLILNNSEAFYNMFKAFKDAEKHHKGISKKNVKEIEHYMRTRTGIIIVNKIYGVDEQ